MKSIFSKSLCIGLSALFLYACDSQEEKAEKFYKSGQEYQQKDELDSAIIEYKNVLKSDPRHLPALRGLAEIYKERDNFNEFFKTALKITQLDSLDVPSRITVAKAYLSAGQTDKALTLSEELMALAPENDRVRVIKALVLFQLNDTEQGLTHAQKAYEINPKNIDAAYLMAGGMLSQGKSQDAINLLNSTDGSVADSIALNVLKIQAFNQLKDLDGAVEVIERLIKRHPENLNFRKVLASQYLSYGEVDKAEFSLRRFAEEQQTVKAMLEVIKFLVSVNEVKRAEFQINQYLQLKPDSPELVLALADLYILQQEKDKAENALLKLLEKPLDYKEKIEARNKLADIAISLRQYEKASQQIELIKQDDPSNLKAIANEARINLRNGKYEDAISDLRNGLSIDAKSSELNMLLGVAHDRQGLTELAKTYYLKSIDTEKPLEIAVKTYAKYLIRDKDFIAAESVLERYLSVHGIKTQLLEQLAQVKLSLRKWDEAQAIADKLIDGGKNTILASQIKGLALTGKNEYQEGIEAFKVAQEAAPDSFQPMAALVSAYMRAGKPDDAINFLNSVLKTSPKNYTANFLLGGIYSFQNKPDEAVVSFKNALDLNEKFMPAYHSLSATYIKLGRLNDAELIALRGLGVKPNDIKLTVVAAQLAQKKGDLTNAINLYKNFLVKGYKADIVKNNLALLLLEPGVEDVNEAVRLTESFTSSDDPFFLDTVGWVLVKAGRYAEAIQSLEKAAKALPNIQEVRYHLGVAYYNNERKVEAKIELKKSLEGQPNYTGVEDAQKLLDTL